MNPLSEQLTVVGDTIVVFTGRDVARAASEIDVSNSRIFFDTPIAGKADKFRCYFAGAVHGGRMHCVIMQAGDALLPMPETDGF